MIVSLTFQSLGSKLNSFLGSQSLEARLLGALMSIDISSSMIEASLLIHDNDSRFSKVANLSLYPEWIANIWAFLALMVMPYFFMQLMGVWCQHKTMITRLACRAILASGVLWGFLSYESKDSNFTMLTLMMILNSATCVLLSAILASSINTSQQREAQRKEANDSA